MCCIFCGEPTTVPVLFRDGMVAETCDRCIDERYLVEHNDITYLVEA